jgi:hypothetical protein
MKKYFIKMPDGLKIIWLSLKLAIVLFAIFQASNVTILYQGF